MAEEYDVADLGLAKVGQNRIDWAFDQMPVLRQIQAEFAREQPFAGMTIAACLHVTAETANLMRALKAGGAKVLLCASNPLSTQDDVAAALYQNDKISVYAIRGENNDSYYKHIRHVLAAKPDLTFDDGADLVSMLHGEAAEHAPRVMASMEETTTGVIRLRAMEKDKALKIPVVAVNDAVTKHLFDNRYGTGQSTMDGILRATSILLAGRTVVVAGYGWCGKGVASRARGMGANVIVTEVDPVKALEALMDGFRVMPMREAAKTGDLFITVTGDAHVISREHLQSMRDGSIICNAGHFDVEIDLQSLKEMATEVTQNVRANVDAYRLPNGRRIFVLGEGRLVNLAAAEGHPSSVMDMSFATQALVGHWVVSQVKAAGGSRRALAIKVHDVPVEVENRVAALKLASAGVEIDKLTSEQETYLHSWQTGT
jgi:adenosylhomocysteinase